MNESIPYKRVIAQFPEDINCIALEINLRVKKWLVVGIYKPPNKGEGYYLNNLPNALDGLLKLNENFYCYSW